MTSAQREAFRGRFFRWAVMSLWLLPSVLHGQADAHVTLPGEAAGRPFAAIDQSLVQRADAMLAANSAPTAVSASGSQGHQPGTAGGSPAAIPQEGTVAWPQGAQKRMEQLRPVVEQILEKEGVPVALTAVIQVESGGNPAALSYKGARGLWQLMPDTARRYGLTVDATHDERLDVAKSTQAAAHYLSDLRLQFGSWPLALAAYNTGEENLQRAIERSHSTEFLVLSSLGLLAPETRNYVPAVMAAMGPRREGALLQKQAVTHGIPTVFAMGSP